jgi:hypothetical protein
MSEPGNDMRPSRGKVWLRLTAGEAMGRPLAEWAYRTPRFPSGIKRSDLTQAPEIGRETIIVWFLTNHIPAKGPYFGFGETIKSRPVGALDTTALDTTPLNGSIEIAGFSQAPFFNGGAAADLLRAEFGGIVEQSPPTEITDLFEGLWEVLPADPLVDLETQTPAQRSATIAGALDDFADAGRKMARPPGGIGHNGPPEDSTTLSEDDQRLVLKASADARLAVTSSNYSAAEVAWGAAKPVFDRIASAIGRHVDTFLNKFAATAGISMALIATGYVGELLGLWNKVQAVTAMLSLAKQLMH